MCMESLRKIKKVIFLCNELLESCGREYNLNNIRKYEKLTRTTDQVRCLKLVSAIFDLFFFFFHQMITLQKL